MKCPEGIRKNSVYGDARLNSSAFVPFQASGTVKTLEEETAFSELA